MWLGTELTVVREASNGECIVPAKNFFLPVSKLKIVILILSTEQTT